MGITNFGLPFALFFYLDTDIVTPQGKKAKSPLNKDQGEEVTWPTLNKARNDTSIAALTAVCPIEGCIS